VQVEVGKYGWFLKGAIPRLTSEHIDLLAGSGWQRKKSGNIIYGSLPYRNLSM
jgi:hypothetical protein